MPDVFQNPSVAMYVALIVTLAVWITLFIYIWRLDQRTTEIRKKLSQQEPSNEKKAPRTTLETRS
jgi:CcmD family protein